MCVRGNVNKSSFDNYVNENTCSGVKYYTWETNMKKILASILLTLIAVPAMAQHWHHGYRHHRPVYYGSGNWVAPLIIGGVVGAAIASRPAQAEPIVVQPTPIVLQPQTMIINGATYTKQIMIIDGVQTEVLVKN